MKRYHLLALTKCALNKLPADQPKSQKSSEKVVSQSHSQEDSVFENKKMLALLLVVFLAVKRCENSEV